MPARKTFTKSDNSISPTNILEMETALAKLASSNPKALKQLLAPYQEKPLEFNPQPLNEAFDLNNSYESLMNLNLTAS